VTADDAAKRDTGGLKELPNTMGRSDRKSKDMVDESGSVDCSIAAVMFALAYARGG
jgi:hypothetical protein